MLPLASCIDLEVSPSSFSFQMSQVILRMQLLQHLLGKPHKTQQFPSLVLSIPLISPGSYFTEAARTEVGAVQQ